MLRRHASAARMLVCALTCGAGLMAVNPAVGAEDAAPLDYQVKAAFLINFPKYVDWPSSAFTEANSPITVAIFGDDNVAGALGDMIKGGRTVDGRPLVLKRIARPEEISADCHIVFIAKSERQRVSVILEKVKGAGILTVGESDDFLDRGGIINLVQRERKIRLQVNLTAAGQAGLKISSRLLVAADAVKGKPE
jgi:hypothetical protein